MNKSQLKLSAILMLVNSGLIWFLSIAYASSFEFKDNVHILLKYFSSFMFLVCLFGIAMSIVNLVSVCQRKENNNYKTFGLLAIIALAIDSLFSISYLLNLDFNKNVFGVTYTIFIFIFCVVSTILELRCLLYNDNKQENEAEIKINKLKDLLDKGLITNEEFDSKKQDILNNL